MSPRNPKQDSETIDVKYEPVFVLLQEGMNVKQAVEHIGMNEGQRVSFYRYMRENPAAKARMAEIKAKSNPLPHGRPKGGGAKKPLDIYGLMVKAYNEMNGMLGGSIDFHQGRFNACFAIVKTYSDKYKDEDAEKFIDFFKLREEYPEFAFYMEHKEEIDAYLKGKKTDPDDIAILDPADAKKPGEAMAQEAKGDGYGPAGPTSPGSHGEAGWEALAGAIGLDSRSSATPGDLGKGPGADITPGPGPEQDERGADVSVGEIDDPEGHGPVEQPAGPLPLPPPRPLDVTVENGQVKIGDVFYGKEEENDDN